MKTKPEKSQASKFICEVCGKDFSKNSLLIRHLLVHDKSAAKFRCYLCAKSFCQKVTLKRHIESSVCERREQKRISQIESPLTVENDSTSMRGSSEANKNVSCTYCDRSFLKPSDLERHIRTHTNERSFKCSMVGCGKSFTRKGTLQRHLSTHGRETFNCNVCLRNYQSHKNLEKHKRMHSRQHCIQLTNPQLPREIQVERLNDVIADNKSILFSDLLCDASELEDASSSPFDSSTAQINQDEMGGEEVISAIDEIDDSLEVVSPTPSKTFDCEGCCKSFKKPIDLRRHFDAVHEKKKPFACQFPQCDKSFSLKCTLLRHKETHSSIRKMVECPVCHKLLSTQSSLNLHLRIHDNLKPHQCGDCNLSFRTPGNLQSHRRTHEKKVVESNFMDS